MQEEDIKVGLRVVTNNGRWGSVMGRTCCWHHGDGTSEHGDHVSCVGWDKDPWWYINEDGYGRVMQNAERLMLHGIRMYDGSYFPEYNDPRGKEAT